MTDIKGTLDQREKTHGDFKDVARTAQALKETCHEAGADKLNEVQYEALDMICSKIARIVCGDPNHGDSWHDIAGYASLAEREVEREIE